MTTQASDILIVGGSVAATRAAETVVRHAPQLSVTVMSDEANAPYERPPLSKIPLDEPLDLGALTYPTVANLGEAGVRFALGTRAESLDLDRRRIATTVGEFEYGALVIATGSEPIIPPLFVGHDDVFVLRQYSDAVALRSAVSDPSTSVAIVGAGFIGGEFAATLVKYGHEVSLVDLAARPLGRFGVAVADAYETLHREAGIELHLGHAVVDVVQDRDGRELLLEDGTRLAADVILLGVGVRPSIAWLTSSGLTLDNGIHCDANLRAADRVFAAGDAVRWPNDRFATSMRVEHWTNAAEQGRIAGLNAASSLLGGTSVTCSNVPYFWSDQHGVRIQFAGVRMGQEEVFESRDDDGALFIYREGDVVNGVLAFEHRQHFVKLRAALRNPLSWSMAQEIVKLPRLQPS